MITIKQSNGPEIEFHGQLLAEVSSRQPNKDRWTELRVYKSDTGKYITESVGQTVFDHEHVRCKAAVFDKLEDITQAFDYTVLAQKLYKKVGFTPKMQV